MPLVTRTREGIHIYGEENLREYASQRAQAWRADMTTEWMEESAASAASRR